MAWGELRSGKDRVLANADRASAHLAIAELIWNALDAEASTVAVTVERNELGAPTVVIINDDGHGMKPADASDLFLTEGDSWKKDKRFSPNVQRPLHGQLGRGRLLVYAVADRAEWSTTAEVGAERQQTRIVGSRAAPTGFEISESIPTEQPSGTQVALTMRDDQKAARVGDDGFELKIVELMAETLHSTRDATVLWEGAPLRPDELISSRRDLALPEFSDDVLRGHAPPMLTVVEWTGKLGSKQVQLCDASGAAASEYKPSSSLPVPFSWTAYLKWDGFRDPTLMGIADLHAPEFKHSELLAAVSHSLNDYLMERITVERGHVVKEWKDEGVYPYQGQPGNDLERAERDVFEVVAVIASDAIPKRGTDQKRLALTLIREALRANPTRLRNALMAVLRLNDEELDSLERLLDRTELGSLIRAAHKVADRLDFVNGLASLLYEDDTRRVFREVDQLHPMLVHEPWVFGDEWDVCLSEHGLTRVVRSVIEAHDDKVLALEPVVLDSNRRGRVDLLFHKIAPESESDRHLVVELKRPGKLTMEHYGQLVNYATAITGHSEIAGARTRWDFWLVGSELDNAVKSQRSADEHGRKGFVKDFGAYRLWVITWGELLDDLRRKYESFRSELGLNPTTDSGMAYLKRAHTQYLPEIVMNSDTPSEPIAADTESGEMT